MPEERPEFNEILLSLEDMRRDPAFQRHRSVPNTPQLILAATQHMAKSEGNSPHSTTSSAENIDKSAQSLQDRLHYSSSDSESESDPPPKEKITSGYID